MLYTRTMELKTYRFTYEQGEVFEVIGFGDWHFLSANCRKGLLERTRDYILADPVHRRWIFMGDGAECITPTDRRWKSRGVDGSLIKLEDADRIGQISVKIVAEFARPIIDQCLVWHDGNHEDTLSRNTTFIIGEEVLSRLGRPDLYAPGQATTRLVFTDKYRKVCSIKINSAHGNKTGQEVGTLINWAVRKLRAYDDVDILMRGHHHHLFAQPCANVSNDTRHSRLRDRVCFVVGTGSALKTLEEHVSSYSEEGDFLPVVLGFPRIFLTPDREIVHLEGRV